MIKQGDICLVTSEPEFYSFTMPEDERWEEIDERIWMSMLLKQEHFHDENLDNPCDWTNPVEEHEVERLVLVNSVEGETVMVTLLDVAKNDWEFDPIFLSPTDIYLDSYTTGLSHSFIVITDITFPVKINQLSNPVITVPEPIFDKITMFGRGQQVEGLKVGNSENKDIDDWKDVERYDASCLTAS